MIDTTTAQDVNDLVKVIVELQTENNRLTFALHPVSLTRTSTTRRRRPHERAAMIRALACPVTAGNQTTSSIATSIKTELS